VAEGDFVQAGKAFTSHWSDARDVQFTAPDLESAYANPAKFGYGRIAVLEATLRDAVSRVGVAKINDKPMLVLAGTIKQGDEIKSLVIVALPVDRMTAPIAAASP